MKYSDLKIISDTSMFPDGRIVFEEYESGDYAFQIIEHSNTGYPAGFHEWYVITRKENSLSTKQIFHVNPEALADAPLSFFIESASIKSHEEFNKKYKDELERD